MHYEIHHISHLSFLSKWDLSHEMHVHWIMTQMNVEYSMVEDRSYCTQAHSCKSHYQKSLEEDLHRVVCWSWHIWLKVQIGKQTSQTRENMPMLRFTLVYWLTRSSFMSLTWTCKVHMHSVTLELMLSVSVAYGTSTAPFNLTHYNTVQSMHTSSVSITWTQSSLTPTIRVCVYAN